MSSRCCLRKFLFHQRSSYESLTFSYSYRLNSRTAMRENLKQSRERSNDVSLPLSSIPQAKDVEGGIHVVSIFNPPHLVLPASVTWFVPPAGHFRYQMGGVPHRHEGEHYMVILKSCVLRRNQGRRLPSVGLHSATFRSSTMQSSFQLPSCGILCSRPGRPKYAPPRCRPVDNFRLYL